LLLDLVENVSELEQKMMAVLCEQHTEQRQVRDTPLRIAANRSITVSSPCHHDGAGSPRR